jgi:hypothetical protein
MLKSGGKLRAMMIDGLVFIILTEGSRIKLVQTDGSLKDAVSNQNKPVKGKLLLQVNNPLEQHILAALRHKPIVGLSRAYESQLFLEQLRGYTP